MNGYYTQKARAYETQDYIDNPDADVEFLVSIERSPSDLTTYQFVSEKLARGAYEALELGLKNESGVELTLFSWETGGNLARCAF